MQAQRASDFLAKRRSDGALETSYPLGGTWAEMDAILPDFATEAIRNGITLLEQKLPGFGGT